MKKFNELDSSHKIVWVYIYSIFGSLLLSPLFYNIFLKLFHPIQGYSGFFYIPDIIGVAFMGGLFSIYFLLPFLIYLLIKEKKKISWFILLIPILLIQLLADIKIGILFIILSFSGWLLAQGILFVKNKTTKPKNVL
jgi:hypothetical protein